MINLNDNMLEDKLNNIIKGIEVLGGNESIQNKSITKEGLVFNIINDSLKGELTKVTINNKEYLLCDIVKEKINFEKHIIKNKNKTVQYIYNSIKRYNTQLSDAKRKYAKTGILEMYQDIEKNIIKIYKEDLNKLLLVNCNADLLQGEECDKYYGEYLSAKREEILNSIINKI